MIYFLVKWSKELETRRFTIFFYFLISTTITPLFSSSNEDGMFTLWFPLGFFILLIYLFTNKRMYRAKLKASLLGLAVAIYKIIAKYNEFI